MNRGAGFRNEMRASGLEQWHRQTAASRPFLMRILAVIVSTAVFAQLGWAFRPGNDRSGKPSPPQALAPLVRIEVRGTAAEGGSGSLPEPSHGSLQREIVDPCLGNRWQWTADLEHPERPARLILLDAGSRPTLISSSPPSREAFPRTVPVRLSPASFAVRAGDRVTVVQETPILRARFQAVALESAPIGESFRVRLIGGADVRTGNQGMVVIVRAAPTGEVVWLEAVGNLP